MRGVFFVLLLCPSLALAQEGAPGLHYYYPVPAALPPRTVKTDVCVYGGTPGGVMTAIQAARMGKSAVLVVFRQHVGGMTSGGLSAVDLGRGESIAGLARDFLTRAGGRPGFLPSKAEAVFLAMLKEAKVPVYFESRLKDVKRDGQRVTAITTENGFTFVAKMFADATYEGDLLAKAGVSFHVGREANAVYKETLNGVQFHNGHNFVVPVDPFKTPGDPKSGLFWGISSADPGKTGDGDRKVQAYNFRMYLSNAPDRLPFPKPADYDRDRYLLLLRYIKLKPPIPLQLHFGDSNNQGAFSTDHIGASYAWPEADYVTREKVFQEHVKYQQGLMWFWANDPEVPAELQKKVKQWGLTKGEFPRTGGWPHELYVREGRRMISDYVMTEHNCRSSRIADDSVGLASYNMDSHNIQRVVINGMVRNEGDVQVGCPKPYPVSYRSIVPKESECTNLFVPVCLSSSHIAYGSIRMEPVFMILGQASGTAAAMAIDLNVNVQKVPYAMLKERLLADKQMLEWTGPSTPGKSVSIDPKSVTGIVVDNADAKFVGDWTGSTAIGPFVGLDYVHDGNAEQGKKSVTFTPKLPAAGTYEVYLIWTPNKNRASNVPVEIVHAKGEERLTVNQREGGGWRKVFTGQFNEGTQASVTIRNDGANGYVIADAVRFLLVELPQARGTYVKTGSLAAPFANQAAAADERFVFAVDNGVIAKYDRETGKELARSVGKAYHLNSGFLWEGKLYCAHSNYPKKPHQSDIRVLDPATMALTVFHIFEEPPGSLTWAVRRGAHWWCHFAHYGKENDKAVLVQFDERWQEMNRWTYPPKLVADWENSSLSGGIWQGDDLLATGHDKKIIYRLRIPREGKVVELVDVIAAPFTGQGIAVDPKTGGLVGIDRAQRLILFAKFENADDAEIAKLLKAKGGEITESKGVVTAVTIPDGSKLTDEEFRQLTHLAHLKTLSLSNGLNDDRLSQLTALSNLESLQTNLAQITDEGVRPLARLKNLKNLSFFHPGKSFSGTGLAHLAEVPKLERLTVAGSLAFNDDGMAAVAKLTGLKEFRTWHAGGTNEGVKKLKELKNLKSLYLGQRLTYKPPACPTDETIAILAEFKSLESLQLDEARLTFGALQQLKQLPALKKLTLGGIDIAKEDVERLRQELPLAKVEWTAPNEVYQKRIGALFGGK